MESQLLKDEIKSILLYEMMILDNSDYMGFEISNIDEIVEKIITMIKQNEQ